MFTVVIPTMWRYKPFIKFLKDLCNTENVVEIIIINNCVEDTPSDPILSNYKIRLLNQPKNIYVNPAWNLGVAEAWSNKICIANDDIVFDVKLFNRLFDLVNPSNGVFGMVCGEPQFNQRGLIDGTLDIDLCNTPYNYQTHFGFGQLMFFDKTNWLPIIDGLNIYWGDNFIYDTFYYKLNRNYTLSNFLFKTPHSATCTTLNEDLSAHYSAEHALYNLIMPTLIRNIHNANANQTGLLL